MATASNIETGPCSVTIGSTDVGHTQGGVRFRIEPKFRERLVDMYGQNAIDDVHMGDAVSATFKVAEKTLANLKVVLPLGKTNGTTCVGVGKTPGTLASSITGTITFHPLEVTGTAQDIVIQKGYANSPIEIPYGFEEDRAFEVTIKGLLDTTKSSGIQMAVVRDT